TEASDACTGRIVSKMVQSVISLGAVFIAAHHAARRHCRPGARVSKGERAKGAKTLLRDLARGLLM
ncbi:MAG: hypothetical protein ACPHE1_00845, partial [Pseudomonadales bacterium]